MYWVVEFKMPTRKVPLSNKKDKLAFLGTVKPVLSGHSKKDKRRVLKTGGSLVQVELLQNGAFCKTFDQQ